MDDNMELADKLQDGGLNKEVGANGEDQHVEEAFDELSLKSDDKFEDKPLSHAPAGADDSDEDTVASVVSPNQRAVTGIMNGEEQSSSGVPGDEIAEVSSPPSTVQVNYDMHNAAVQSPVSRCDLLDIVRKHSDSLPRPGGPPISKDENPMDDRYWREMLDMFFVRGWAGTGDTGRQTNHDALFDDMLFFVRLESAPPSPGSVLSPSTGTGVGVSGEDVPNEKTKPFFVRKWSNDLKKVIGESAQSVDWRKSFYLNLICHTSFSLTVAVCSRQVLDEHRKAKKTVIPVSKFTKRVYATPSKARIDGDASKTRDTVASYPDICFAIDDYDDPFNPVDLSDADHCFCVLLNAHGGSAFPLEETGADGRPAAASSAARRTSYEARALGEAEDGTPKLAPKPPLSPRHAHAHSNGGPLGCSPSKLQGLPSKLRSVQEELLKLVEAQHLAHKESQAAADANTQGEKEGKGGGGSSAEKLREQEINHQRQLRALQEELKRIQDKLQQLQEEESSRTMAAAAAGAPHSSLSPPSPSGAAGGLGELVKRAAFAAGRQVAGYTAGGTLRVLPLRCSIMGLSLPWDSLTFDLLFKELPRRVDITGHVLPRLPSRDLQD
eukprot:jgi/Mesen1/10521/ME000083S10029